MTVRGEHIRLAAVFEPGKRVRPVWFELNRTKHVVTETTYFWKDRIGDITLLHFAVTDGAALYELIYNPMEQSWTLQAQQAE